MADTTAVQAHGTQAGATLAHAAPAGAPYYYVPPPARWPMVGMIAMVFTTFGGAMLVNHHAAGSWLLLAGFVVLVYMLTGWFASVARESEAGAYNARVDGSFRWGMGWFIFSEVMFFASFFGALFYARVLAVPALGNFDHKLLWPDFAASWPTVGPAGTVDPFSKISPWPLPTVNTVLLMTSGLTLTIAHHALLAAQRSKAVFWMVVTLLLGFTFVGVQAYEYAHAYSELNLRLSSGVFGSTFFMLTGFHGFHVIVGAIMLTVVCGRLMKGHFTPSNHFAFEGAAWYWHFVDVVWIGLYIVVYWL
jgi:cytochrome c oxidase subunit 3